MQGPFLGIEGAIQTRSSGGAEFHGHVSQQAGRIGNQGGKSQARFWHQELSPVSNTFSVDNFAGFQGFQRTKCGIFLLFLA
jgi:hypothetical protein